MTLFTSTWNKTLSGQNGVSSMGSWSRISHTVWVDLNLTCLVIESPIINTVGDSAPGVVSEAESGNCRWAPGTREEPRRSCWWSVRCHRYRKHSYSWYSIVPLPDRVSANTHQTECNPYITYPIPHRLAAAVIILQTKHPIWAKLLTGHWWIGFLNPHTQSFMWINAASPCLTPTKSCI